MDEDFVIRFRGFGLLFDVLTSVHVGATSATLGLGYSLILN